MTNQTKEQYTIIQIYITPPLSLHLSWRKGGERQINNHRMQARHIKLHGEHDDNNKASNFCRLQVMGQRKTIITTSVFRSHIHRATLPLFINVIVHLFRPSLLRAEHLRSLVTTAHSSDTPPVVPRDNPGIHRNFHQDVSDTGIIQ